MNSSGRCRVGCAPLLLVVALLAWVHSATPTSGLPLPTPEQQAFMEMGFTQFMHFSVTTFGNIEHDCVDGKCLPASMFNPSKLDTDQWVQTAVAMGAGEICLTAHHEGGFCLWPTKYSNYSVMASPYPHDIVKMFVASCRKYNVRPCFYIGPNANGYLTQVVKYTPTQFVAAQKGMITEVLTQYGFIHRLWWDHYEDGCGGLSECPGGFPAAWAGFTSLVRSISPKTVLGTGPDVGHSLGGESGVGSYPIWNMCNTTNNDPVQRCQSWGPDGSIFRPREADATIQNPGDAWFWKKDHKYWNASTIWQHYMLTVGRGDNFILNMPPDETGQIPEKYVDAATKFGDALRGFRMPLVMETNIAGQCGQNSPIELQFGKTVTFNAIVSREDMGLFGQRIAKYSMQALVGSTWTLVDNTHGQTVGNRVIDFPSKPITASALRFTCLQSVASNSDIYLKSLAVFSVKPPMS